MTELAILAVVLVGGLVVGLVLRSRAGRVTHREGPALVSDQRRQLFADAGIDPTASTPTTGALIVHFSADWCGPCAAVSRVIAQVVSELADTPHPPVEIELDIDEYGSLAKELSVLSLPTTFLFDHNLTERARISGVPKAAELKAALTPLTGVDLPDA